MNFTDLNHRLEGKVKLTREERDRYSDYTFSAASGQIVLPTVIRVRHENEVKLAPVAAALGLRHLELRQMLQCSIGRRCTLVALATRLLLFVNRKEREQGAMFAPGMLAMIESVECILTEIVGAPEDDPTPEERHLMGRCMDELSTLVGNQHMGSVAARIHAIAGRCANTK